MNSVPRISDHARLSILIHFGFLLTGIVTTMLGPLLPFLSSTWELNDAQAGALFSLQSGGSLLGIAASTYLTPRGGFARSLALGAGLMATGVAGLSLGSQVVGMASILVYGSGLGITIPGVNVLSAALNPRRQASALNILNSVWCLGAFAGPTLIATSLQRKSLPIFLLVLAGLLIGASLWYWREGASRSGELGRAPKGPAGTTAKARGTGAWLIGLLLFLYVGVETSTWGWIATYARRLGVTQGDWAWLQSTFWLAILLGRLLSPVALKWISGPKLVLASLSLVVAGTAELILVSQVGALMLGAGLAGAGMACIYPTTVAAYADRYGSQDSRASGVVFMLAILGGAVIPWLVGFLSDLSGSLRAAMLIPVTASLAMIGIQTLLIRTHPTGSAT